MIISFGNFKGGVGKTTTTSVFGYILSELKGYDVLLVDTDQQGDLTDEVENTFQVQIDRSKNLFNACFESENVTDQVQTVSSHLDVLAGSTKMRSFSDTIQEAYPRKSQKEFHRLVLKETLKEVKNSYDFVLLDTNPAVDLLTENVLSASDYLLIPTKSLARDSEDTKIFYNYLIDESERNTFEVLGIVAYLVEDSATDRKIINSYKDLFERELFENIIKNSAVVKRWSHEGITLDRAYDQRTMSMYEKVVDEALSYLPKEEA